MNTTQEMYLKHEITTEEIFNMIKPFDESGFNLSTAKIAVPDIFVLRILEEELPNDTWSVSARHCHIRSRKTFEEVKTYIEIKVYNYLQLIKRDEFVKFRYMYWLETAPTRAA